MSGARGEPWLQPRQAVAVLAVLALAAFLAFRALALPWSVSGRSMAPALEPGDRVLVDLWSYRHRPPRTGEIALLEAPDGTPVVKRVAGYSPDGIEAGFRVLGDNAVDSLDSRRFGPVPRERFRGRVVLRYWPPSRLGRPTQ